MSGRFAAETCHAWIDVDPRTRILSLAFIIIAVSAVSRTVVLAVLCMGSFLLIIPSGMRPGMIARRLAPVNMFLALLWLTMPFLAEGPYWQPWGGLGISLPGVHQALAITLKANAIVAATSALVTPLESGFLAVGLHRLGMPTKLVWLLLLAHRYVIGMADSVRKAALAIRLRSGRRGRLRFRAYGGLFAKLFAGGHESGDRLFLAMLSRGYGDGLALRRTLVWRGRDSLVTLGMACLAGCAVWIGTTA